MQLARERGHKISRQNADAVIINTCTVTSASDHKNLRAIHKIRREHPQAILAACGCFAQLSPALLQETGEVDIICGTTCRADEISLCENWTGSGPVCAESRLASPSFERLPAGVLEGRTRGLLKIEDGCDNFCAYCIIPYARGRVRSMPSAEAVSQAKALAAAGVREIMITGIEISSYGKDLPEKETLGSLTETLLRTVPEVRFRLGSLEPRIIDEVFCQRLADCPNLARHFHLSLQSGCDRTLKTMGRRYTTGTVYENICLLRRYFPGCSVTGDLIVGFPGETKADFEETMEFIKACGFASLHVFPYSIRQGTRAAGLPGQVEERCKAARAAQAKTAAQAMSFAFLQGFVGKTIDVLLESPKPGYTPGHSSWHFPVKVLQAAHGKNEDIAVRITGVDGECLMGIPAEAPQ